MKNLLTLIFTLCLPLLLSAQIYDTTGDRWFDDDDDTNLNVPGEVNIVKNAIGSSNNQKERIIKMKITDSDNFFSIDNIANHNNTFVPTLVGQASATASNANGLWLLGAVDPARDVASAGGAGLTFQSRRSSDGAMTNASIQHANLFRWMNGNSTHMLMRPDGELGIGTTNPTARLHVNGSVRFDNLANGTAVNMLGTDASGNVVEATIPNSNDADWYESGTSNAPTSNSVDIYRSGKVAIGGSINSSYTLTIYGDGLASGGHWQWSDARLKTNIKSIAETANDALMNLNGYSYNYIQDSKLNFPSELQYGFLAQELEKQIPESVRNIENGESEVKVVEKSFVLPFLVEGHKYQAKIIADQNSRIQYLENEIEELKNIMANATALNIDDKGELQKGFDIFPNPNNGSFTLNLNYEANSDQKISVFNMRGELVYDQILNAKTTQISIDNIHSGLYKVVLIENDRVVKTKDIVIE